MMKLMGANAEPCFDGLHDIGEHPRPGIPEA